MKDIIIKLEQLGFTSYEAKAYYTLLRKYPANGYEISKISRIPAAKIYDTLNRLKIKGLIIESSTDTGRYYPLPPSNLISKVKDDFKLLIDDLELQLQETEPIADIELTMNISGYDNMVDKMVAVIENCHSTLIASIWPQELVLLSDSINAAHKRGVTVVVAVFGESTLNEDYCVNIVSCGESARERLGKRLTAIVGDSHEVVIGEVDIDCQAEGIWTTTPGIVLVTKEYIKHDIWGHAMRQTLGEERFQSLYEKNPLLNYLIKNR